MKYTERLVLDHTIPIFHRQTMDPQGDPVVSTIPVHLSSNLVPHVVLHQFPLFNHPLQVPPSAALSGKRIGARVKKDARRFEIHVPIDARPEVWNVERSKEFGSGRLEDDKEKNQDKGRARLGDGEEPRLTEFRLRSEDIPQVGAYMLGVVRNGVVTFRLTFCRESDNMLRASSSTSCFRNSSVETNAHLLGCTL